MKTKWPMMKCGHAANGRQADDRPVCVICYGIKDGADEIDEAKLDLTGRMARCTYCFKEQPSDTQLAYFRHLPEQEKDRFYCGCRGWN